MVHVLNTGVGQRRPWLPRPRVDGRKRSPRACWDALAADKQLMFHRNVVAHVALPFAQENKI